MGVGGGVPGAIPLSVAGTNAALSEAQLKQVADYLLRLGIAPQRKAILAAGPREFTAGRPVGLASDGLIAPSLLPLIPPSQIDPQGAGSGLDADTVDGAHYSTSTWTPTLTFGGGTIGLTGSFAGSSERIGNLVTFRLRIALTAKGSSTGVAVVGNLPFANTAGNAFVTACTIRMINATLTGDVIPNALISGSVTDIALTVADSGTSANMTDAHFANNTQLIISGSYRTV